MPEKPVRQTKKRGPKGAARVKLPPSVATVVYDDVDLSTWSDEELMRGKKRNKNGKFNGRAPNVLPAKLLKEWQRRKMSQAFTLLQGSLVDGAAVLAEIANNKEVDPMARLRAVEIMFNRVVGKPREQITFDIGGEDDEPAWKKLVRLSIVADAAAAVEMEKQMAEEDVVEGEIVEDELADE